MYHSLIVDCFKRFKMYYKGQEIIFGDIENIINNNIANLKEGNYIINFPKDNNYILIIQTMYQCLNYYLNNIFESNEDILDIIKVGDIVEYNKSLACFDGIDHQGIILRFKDGRHWLPYNLRYKINKYNGDAIMLNKMPTKIINSSKKPKSLLAEILNIDMSEMSKTIKKTMLIIASKDQVDDIVKSLEIRVGNHDKVSISEVFTMGYYTSKDGCYFYKGNSKKEEALIKFTAKVYIAMDLIKSNKKITNVLFLPKKIIDADLNDLIRISRRKTIYSVTTIVNNIDVERRINDSFMEDGCKLVEINFDNSNENYVTNINRRQSVLISNYINENINYKTVEDLLITKLRNRMNKSCKIILNSFKDDNDIFRYVVSARRLCRMLTSILIPISEYDRISYEIGNTELSVEYNYEELLNQYKKLILKNLHLDILTNIENIFECIKGIYFEINKSNFKWKEISQLIRVSSGSNISIIIENKHMRSVTQQYIRDKLPYLYNVVIENSNTNNKTLHNVTIIGGMLYENLYWNYRRCNSKKVFILGYKYEYSYYKSAEMRYFKFIKKSDINLKEDSDFELEVVKDTIENLNLEEYISLENDIEDLISIKYIPEMKMNEKSALSYIECEAVINFTNGKKAFLTSKYNAYVLNENKEELIQKKLKDLNIGDILIFIEGIDKDLIDNIIQQLMEFEQIKTLYSETFQLSKMWKRVLIEYKDNNKLTFKNLSQQLNLYGINRESATIRSWMIDAIVGPQEEDVYRVIGRISGNEFLNENYKKVFNACNDIRSLQVRVRKAIVKSLLKDSTLDSSDYIDNLIMKNINDTIDYVKKVEIQKIHKTSRKLPVYITNKILGD